MPDEEGITNRVFSLESTGLNFFHSFGSTYFCTSLRQNKHITLSFSLDAAWGRRKPFAVGGVSTQLLPEVTCLQSQKVAASKASPTTKKEYF